MQPSLTHLYCKIFIFLDEILCQLKKSTPLHMLYITDVGSNLESLEVMASSRHFHFGGPSDDPFNDQFGGPSGCPSSGPSGGSSGGPSGGPPGGSVRWSARGSARGSGRPDLEVGAQRAPRLLVPHICHKHHQRCLCKKNLPGVIFSRFNAKNWHFAV